MKGRRRIIGGRLKNNSRAAKINHQALLRARRKQRAGIKPLVHTHRDIHVSAVLSWEKVSRVRLKFRRDVYYYTIRAKTARNQKEGYRKARLSAVEKPRTRKPFSVARIRGGENSSHLLAK